MDVGNLNVALLGSAGYGRNLGKKGTESDITFYNLKKGDDTVTFVEPSSYPEKFSSLFYSLSNADYTLFVVSEIDAYFGEMLLAIHYMDIERTAFVLQNYHTAEEIETFLEEIPLRKYEFFEDEPGIIREHLLDIAGRMEGREEEEGTVSIDHFFNVKGVGTVALGNVVRGSIRKHDDAMLLPLKREVHIRSIQKHDDDFEVASKGDRVGLALKNVESEELKRGDVITTENLSMSQEIKIELRKNRYWKGEVKDNTVFHIGHWMQFLPARMKDDVVHAYKPLVYGGHARMLVTHLDAGIPRIVGVGVVKK
jgi:selenocysteine-specific translation elongation factor